jgi:carbamoyltransferase
MKGKVAVLGISAYYHDSAAALVVDGEIVAAAQEERFSRIKNDSAFPAQAIRYVLADNVPFEELSAVVFYDKPFLKFERLLETYHAFAPRGLRSFVASMPVWLNEKLFLRRLLRKQLKPFGRLNAPLLFSEHHLSHAASAFYPSPFEKAAILTIDGAGEWATAAIGAGDREGVRIIKELHFPHSAGLLYSAFTYFLGFEVNSGEYKLMGLAPYGDAHSPRFRAFREKILTELADVREDGSFILNMSYFGFATGLTMIRREKWERLFGLSRREPESEITGEHADLALAIQQVTELIVTRLARRARELTSADCLVMAGGVALNSVANSRIASSGLFRDIWIQPAAGDAGGALGAALAGYHIYFKGQRRKGEGMKHACLGPEYTAGEIEGVLKRRRACYTCFPCFDDLARTVCRELGEGKITGWFQGRMEFGPRALGNRSILADPRNPDIRDRLNRKVKFRESFRPFAPSVLEEDAALWFSIKAPSPYMLFVVPLKEDRRTAVPAVTHVDDSARVQTVSREANPRFRQLLCCFKELTGTGMLVNTSFNVRGEPVVCTPEEAYDDFLRSGMDCLVLGDFLLYRNEQHPEISLPA